MCRFCESRSTPFPAALPLPAPAFGGGQFDGTVRGWNAGMGWNHDLIVETHAGKHVVGRAHVGVHAHLELIPRNRLGPLALRLIGL